MPNTSNGKVASNRSSEVWLQGCRARGIQAGGAARVPNFPSAMRLVSSSQRGVLP